MIVTCDEGKVPHATSFQQMLANAQLETINYLMQKFINITSSKNMAVQVIFDYEGISTPCSVYNGTMVDCLCWQIIKMGKLYGFTA